MPPLGPILPADVAAAELRALDVDPCSQPAQVLLHMAGPYARRGDWLENTTIGGRGQAAAAADMVFQRCPAPSVKSLVHTLTDLGMPPEVVAAYFETHVELRRFGDVCVRWSGDSAANMAEAVLHVLGAPAAAEEIFDNRRRLYEPAGGLRGVVGA